MANTKEYKIVINGITESVKAVVSLNKQLESLEARINELNSKAIKINTSSTGGGYSSGGGGSKSSSSKDISVQNEINKLKQEEARLNVKIAASEDEIFKIVDATKAKYKERIADQKAVAAEERHIANEYSHTMMGMKQKLADVKQIIQTTVIDEPDGQDRIKKLTQEANELTDKLKEMEEAYGQFGRNVGNYKSAFDGLDKVKITIGGTVREFGSAKEASRTLNNELKTMAVNGQQDTQAFKELRQAVMQLESAANDAKKPMDDLMDSMESIMAIASVGQGISALFGFDDSEIQRSIQKLVALQNVMKGIETINKQIQTGEGIGKWASKSSEGVDSLVTKLTGAEKRMGLFVGSTRAASIAINALSTALKGLAAIGIVAVISAITWAAEKAYEAFVDWVRGNDKLIDSEKKLNVVLKATNDELERKLKLNQARADANNISATQKQIDDEKALAEAIMQTNKEVEKRMKLNPNNSTFAAYASGAKGNEDIFKDKGVTTLGGFTEEIKDADELIRRYNALSDAVDKNTGLVYKNTKGFEIAHLTASDARDEFNHLEQMLAGRLYNAMKQFDLGTEEGRKGLQDFINQIIQSDDVMYKSALLRLPELVDNEKGNLGTALNALLDLIRQFVAGADAEMNRLNFEKFANSLIDAADETGKRLRDRQVEQLKAQYNSLTKEQQAQQKKLYDDALAAIEKNFKKRSQKVSAGYKKLEKDTREAENDLANLRVANMKEGLNKVLKQLEEERKQRLAKVEADGRLVAERQAEINILYDKKILDAKKDWAEKVQQAYRDMWDNIYNYSLETARKIEELLEQSYEIGKQNWDYGKDVVFNMPDYGVQGFNQLSKSTQEDLKIEQTQNKKLAEIYSERIKVINGYWKERESVELSAVKAIHDEQIQVENEEFEKEKRDREKNWNEQQKLQSDWYDKKREEAIGLAKEEKWSQKELDIELINIDKEYQKAATALYEQYALDEKIIIQQHSQNLQKIEQDKVNKVRNIYMESYRQRLQELRDFQTAIANLESKQPVYNIFGTTNFKQTNANYNILLESYKKQADEIVKIKQELQDKLNAREITFDDFQNANRELDTFVDNLGQKMDEVKYKLSIGGQIQQFVQDMQVYIQAVSQSLTQIMQAVWDAQDTQFDKEQEEIDKNTEKIQEALQKEEDLVQSHKEKINSLEDELATARGDRRQHLIDQINAEMEAERQAAKQTEKLKREEEAQKKKEEELEKKRKKAQYKRDMAQAVVNGAMAVTMAAVNNWPMPAIAMMALAAATTAAQIAIMSANKPYAKGGLLEGPSHKQGGIPVGNTGIEVEGKEYVIRKKSTTPNVELLDYINKSERRLNLDDFIDFYSSGKIKKTISSISPRSAFADGGVIPTINNDYSFDDRLINAFEDYSNRPVYVTVKDINERQAAVKNVQVLAGLE